MMPSGQEPSVAHKSAQDRSSVFVVYGRDEFARDQMFTFLRSIGLRPIEWSQAIKATNKASPFIGEVLDVAFRDAQAIVVLMTPDEVVYLRSELASGDADGQSQPMLQPRPNVLFEAGMAMGRQSARTVLVQVGDIRPFSDVSGRHTVRLDNSVARRKDLAQRLETAGCPVDLSGDDWLKSGDFRAREAPSHNSSGESAMAEPAPDSFRVRVHDFYDRVDWLHSWPVKPREDGLLTPWPRLDRAMRGFLPGSVMLLAGPGGAGKTSLALNVVVNAVTVGQGSVLYVSLSDAGDQLVARIVSIASNVDTDKFLNGELVERDFGSLAPALNRLSGADVRLVDEAGATLDRVAQVIGEWRAARPRLELVVVDDLMSMRRAGPGSDGGPLGTDAAVRAVRHVQAVARRSGAHVLLLAGLTADSPAGDGDPREQSNAVLARLSRHADVAGLLQLGPPSGQAAIGRPVGLSLDIVKGGAGTARHIQLWLDRETGIMVETRRGKRPQPGA
jgi:predicted nucleotide-binding protein